MTKPNPLVVACKAVVASTGAPCKNRAIAGGAVCHFHGGKAPQVKAAAARRVAAANLQVTVGALLEQIAHDPVPDLIDGLLIAVDHCARMVAVYRLVVEQRDPLGVNRHDEQVADPGMVEYRAWLAEWAKITKLALDAGIDERRTKLVEADARRFFDMVSTSLDAAGLTLEQRTSFKASLAGELRTMGKDGTS